MTIVWSVIASLGALVVLYFLFILAAYAIWGSELEDDDWWTTPK